MTRGDDVDEHDAVVVAGGAAGLPTMVLDRSRRTVAVVDSRQPCTVSGVVAPAQRTGLLPVARAAAGLRPKEQVRAAGQVTDSPAHGGAVITAGAIAGSRLDTELSGEDTRLAVEPRRAEQSAPAR